MTKAYEPYSFSAEFAKLLPKKTMERLAPLRGQATATTAETTGTMGAAVSIATYPPLGQVTQVGRLDASGEAIFWAMLEMKTSAAVAAEQPGHTGAWEVALWHNGVDAGAGSTCGSSWIETPMTPVVGGNRTFWPLQNTDPSVVRLYYRASVAVRPDGRPLQFTIKFRSLAANPSLQAPAPWRWVSEEQQQMDDGVVLVHGTTSGGSSPKLWPSWLGGKDRSAQPQESSLPDLVQHLNPAFHVTSHRSQSPGTQLWALDMTVQGADAALDRSSWTDVRIGLPWGPDLLRWMALVRIWTPWLGPRHGRAKLNLDGLDAVLCAFLSPGGPDSTGGGRHLVFLAVSGVRHVQSAFQSDTDGHLVLHVRNDSLEAETATVLVAVGDSFETANAAVLYHARSLVSQMQTVEDVACDEKEIQEASQALGSGDVHSQWLETWYDGLGFCTWNAIGQNLSEEKIVATVDTLAEHGIQVASLIIDDNWQSLDRTGNGQFQHTWKRFEADAEQFPHGLAHTVQRIRAAHPHIQHIAVWHALLGYWGGVSPEGDIAAAYETVVVERAHARRRNLPVAGPMTVVAGADVRRLYDDFYRFLAAAGIDGVKTDAQFMMDTWMSAAVRRSLTTAYQDAWTLATLRHFASRGIACMAQTPPILFHAQLPTNRPAVLARNSDDFFPNEPASHPWHVWANAFNSLLTQHLNVLPDWDMFQTVHAYSGFHAAARCISGGPIYITDVPGQHDLGLLAQMTGQTVAGRDGRGSKTVVFRPSVVGRALDPYVGFHDGILLKVGAYHGNATTGAGLVGVFNVSDRPVSELLPLARVPGVEDADDGADARFVARVHSSGRVTATPLRAAEALLPLSLGVGQYEIVSVYRAMGFSWSPDEDEQEEEATLYVANLGLLEKMAAAATVVSTTCMRREGRRRLEMNVSLKAPGVLGLYVSAALRPGRKEAAAAMGDPDRHGIAVESHFLVTMRGQVIPPHCVRVSAQDTHVLEIDTACAWHEMGFVPLWTNEVQVTVFILW